MEVYLDLVHGEWKTTMLRPAPGDIDPEDSNRIERQTHLHAPGNGRHYLPGPLVYYHRPEYRKWMVSRRQSFEAVLAHVDDICQEMGWDYEQLYRRAYPGELWEPTTEEDRQGCARRATINDIAFVINDLIDINYHALAHELERISGGGN
jgi:hypothetical protein